MRAPERNSARTGNGRSSIECRQSRNRVRTSSIVSGRSGSAMSFESAKRQDKGIEAPLHGHEILPIPSPRTTPSLSRNLMRCSIRPSYESSESYESHGESSAATPYIARLAMRKSKYTRTNYKLRVCNLVPVQPTQPAVRPEGDGDKIPTNSCSSESRAGGASYWTASTPTQHSFESGAHKSGRK